MAQPRQVFSFSQQFLNSGKSLDILVNNAGCMVNDREMIEGLEVNFVTNTLSTYILTKALMPLVAKSDKPRIYIVSSGGMLTQKLNWQDLNHEKMSKFDGTSVYAQNKRQQVIIFSQIEFILVLIIFIFSSRKVVMAEYLARTNPNIYFATMHPGWSDTPAVQTSMPSFREKMINKLRTPEQGADTLVWMCCFDNIEKFPNGSFFQGL